MRGAWGGIVVMGTARVGWNVGATNETIVERSEGTEFAAWLDEPADPGHDASHETHDAYAVARVPSGVFPPDPDLFGNETNGFPSTRISRRFLVRRRGARRRARRRRTQRVEPGRGGPRQPRHARPRVLRVRVRHQGGSTSRWRTPGARAVPGRRDGFASTGGGLGQRRRWGQDDGGVPRRPRRAVRARAPIRRARTRREFAPRGSGRTAEGRRTSRCIARTRCSSTPPSSPSRFPYTPPTVPYQPPSG